MASGDTNARRISRLAGSRLVPLAEHGAGLRADLTRYREAFSWTQTVDDFLTWTVTETPLLNACSGRTPWGDVTLDKYEKADVQGEWTQLPFERDSFGAVFADPPWDSGHKSEVAAFVREALRVAPVAYLMAPWIYGAAWADLTNVWYRQFPGIHQPILLSRYERSRQLLLLDQPLDRPTRSEQSLEGTGVNGLMPVGQGDEL